MIRFWGIFVVLALAGLAGCGRHGPEVVPVEGKITYSGGPWPQGGNLYFTPVESATGFPMRPGSAEFGLDGRFTVTSFKPGDGLVPGRYHVGVECWVSPPVMGSKSPAKSAVPANYRSPATSGLELNVRPDQRKVTVEWDVPKPGSGPAHQ
jgi:hypothetical protein